VNQISPVQSTSAGCIYYQAMNHIFDECLILLAYQALPEPMNVAFTKPTNNPYSQTYNLGLEKSSKFLMGSKHQFLSPISPTISNTSLPTQFSQSSSVTFLPKSCYQQKIYWFGENFDIFYAEYGTSHILIRGSNEPVSQFHKWKAQRANLVNW